MSSALQWLFPPPLPPPRNRSLINERFRSLEARHEARSIISIKFINYKFYSSSVNIRIVVGIKSNLLEAITAIIPQSLCGVIINLCNNRLPTLLFLLEFSHVPLSTV